MNALEVTALAAGYGGDGLVIEDVSFSVARGEIVALLGANGAGKTTTVRSISGIVTPRAGSVRLLGVDVTSLPIHRRARLGLGVVTDEPMVCSAMSVADNLRVSTTRADHRDEVTSWMPQLIPLVRQAAGTLSGGEQRLVALARALVRRPEVLVVDELSAGLAPAFATSITAVLQRAAREWNTAVLIVEQATALALRAAHRAVVLARGRVALDGYAAELAQRPDVLETAYLGRS